MSNEKSFVRSNPGRIVSASVALGLIGGGASGWFGPGTSTAVFALSFILATMFSVLALFLAVEEFAGAAILGSILLPEAGFLAALGAGLASEAHSPLSFVFVFAGCAFLAFAIRSPASAPAETPGTTTRTTPAHAS